MRCRSPQYDFNKGCAELLMYLTRHREIDIEEEYIATDGFCLGNWIRDVRELWAEGSLTKKQIRKLQALGLSIEESGQNWEVMYRNACEYYDRYGNCDMPISYRTEEGILLGAWVDKQRRLVDCDSRVIQDYKDRLLEIGIGKGDRLDEH